MPRISTGAHPSRLPLRIAVITETSARTGSTLFRALNHVPRLRERVETVDVFMPEDVVPRPPGPLGRASFFARHGARYLRRARELARCVPRYDAVYVQRGAYPMGPERVVSALDGYEGRVVFDLDDAVFVSHPFLATKGRGARWLYGPQQAISVLERADAVVVSTPELDEALPGRRADVILPTVPDLEGYPTVRHHPGRSLRVGWIGNAGNVPYLDPLADVFARLRDDGIAELEVVSTVPWSGPSTHRLWRREVEPAVFESWDVGIMPLSDTPYTRAKAGLKLLQYMAAGSAVVASPVGINSWIVEESGAGMLASTPEEWETALRRLADDAALRGEMGARAKRWITEYADLDAQADVLVDLLSGRSHSTR